MMIPPRRYFSSEIDKLKHFNVLIVDDEKDICSMFAKWLEQERFTVEYVLSGNKALEILEKTYFDIVFLDIIMPGVSAVEVLEKIKEISPKTKIVAISGQLIDRNLRESVQKRGAVDILQKPFKIEDIMKYLPD
jgi:CheY-like chemotaxis protein